jgi:hypothetical protein
MGLLWTRLADLPSDALTVSSGTWGLRHRPVAGMISSKIYLSGGYSQGDTETARSETYEYNPTTDAWVLVRDGSSNLVLCPHKHVSGSGAVVNGKLALFGGSGYAPDYSNQYSYLDLYDPTTKTWTTDDLPSIISSTWQNVGNNACCSYNNKLYSFGGIAGRYSDTQQRAYVWDPAQSSGSRWSATASWASLDIDGLFQQAVAVYGTKAYLFGGMRLAAGTPAQSYTLIYDFVADSWTRGADMPITTESGAAGVIGSTIYYTRNGTTYAYDPATDAWDTLTSVVTVTSSATEPAYLSTGTKMYLVGGDGTVGTDTWAGNRVTQVLGPTVYSHTATCDGTATLDTTAILINVASATLTGDGTATATSATINVVPADATLAGTGTLVGTTNVAYNPYLGAVVNLGE